MRERESNQAALVAATYDPELIGKVPFVRCVWWECLTPAPHGST